MKARRIPRLDSNYSNAEFHGDPMNQLPQNTSDIASAFRVRQRGISSLGDRDYQQVRDFVESVVRRTRLWHRERNEVRTELLAHFDDGVDAGHAVEKLLSDFGSPRVAAQLIRQAKLRNRPWHWHVWHRSLQASLTLAGLAVCWLVFVYVRLHLGVSGPHYDAITKLDEPTSKLPASQRAWPYYRAGMLAVKGYSKKTENLPHPTIEFSVQGPTDPAWKSTVELLDANTKAIDLFVEGSTKPHFGYIYRDPNNDEWLTNFSFPPSGKIYPARLDDTSLMILLPQINELVVVRSFLEAAAVRAMEKKSLSEFQRYWQAQANLGRQLMDERHFLVTQGIGKASVLVSLRLLRILVSEHPELLSDADLLAWHNEIRAGRWTSKLSVADAFRRFADELLQNGYTQTQDGDGRITPEGCRMLRLWLAFSDVQETGPWQALLAEKQTAGMTGQASYIRTERSTVKASLAEATSLRWSATLANRLEMQQEFNRLLKLLDEHWTTPAATRPDPAQSPYNQDLQKLSQDPARFRRYWPVLVFLPRYGDGPTFYSESDDGLELAREATQATLALEQFRRRTGKWPERLEQLVPQYLPSLPGERFKKTPLIYRIVDGRPLLYTYGGDGDDDGGRPAPRVHNRGDHDGDNTYLPVSLF